MFVGQVQTREDPSPEEEKPELQRQVEAPTDDEEYCGQFIQDDAPASEYVLTPQVEHTKRPPVKQGMGYDDTEYEI